MWRWDHGCWETTSSRSLSPTIKEILSNMKKLMTAMLGLSLLTGVVALADDKGADKTSKEKKAKKKVKKEKPADKR